MDSTGADFRLEIIEGEIGRKIKTEKINKIHLTLMQDGPRLYMRWNDMIYELLFKGNTIYSEPVLNVGNIPGIICFRDYKHLGMYMLGTSTEGVYICQKQSMSTLTFKKTELNVIYSQVPFGEDGALTSKGVLMPGKEILMDSALLAALLKTKKGNYFYTSKKDRDRTNIVEINENLKEINRIVLDSVDVFCFEEYPEGQIWVAGTNDRFVGIMSDTSVRWIDRPKGLRKDFEAITFFHFDSATILVGGPKGMIKYNLDRKSLHIYPELIKKNVRTFFKDSKGVVWIGTYTDGFYALYKNRIEHLPLDQGKYLITANAFMEDKNGFLWISTNKGLFQTLLKDLYWWMDQKKEYPYYYYYDKCDGMLTNEFNGGCTPPAIRLNNGKFSFSSMNGLVQFYPEKIKPFLPVNDLNIDEISVDTTVIKSYDKIRIPADYSYLHISVSTPYMGNHYNLIVEYNLEGLDDNWYPVDMKNGITFNKLEHGKYKLHLRKKAGFGHNNYVTRDLQFCVAPAFTESWGFRTALIVVIIILTYLFFLFRFRFLLRQKQKLENEVAARTLEQEKLIIEMETTMEELEDSNEALYRLNLFKEKMAMIITHDIQSPLRFLSDSSRRFFEIAARNNNTDYLAVAREMQKTTGNIYAFVEEFGIWIHSQDNNFQIDKKPFRLEEILQELWVFFSQMLVMNGNKIVLNVPRDIYINSDKQMLKIIIRNIIDNANKHTQNGLIQIDFVKKGAEGELIIKDNGKGMTALQLQHLRKRISESHQAKKNIERGKQLGYQIILDFSMNLGINISADSEEHKGTTVTIHALAVYDPEEETNN